MSDSKEKLLKFEQSLGIVFLAASCLAVGAFFVFFISKGHPWPQSLYLSILPGVASGFLAVRVLAVVVAQGTRVKK